MYPKIITYIQVILVLVRVRNKYNFRRIFVLEEQLIFLF